MLEKPDFSVTAAFPLDLTRKRGGVKVAQLIGWMIDTQHNVAFMATKNKTNTEEVLKTIVKYLKSVFSLNLISKV